MMIQLGLGGYSLDGNATLNDSSSVVYLEPGFNIMFPADIEVPSSDLIYILIRKRDSASGDSFESILAADYSSHVTDATTGEIIDSSIIKNTGGDLVTSTWNTVDYTPLVLSFTPFSPYEKSYPIRIFDIEITEVESNEFVSARIVVSGSAIPFAYLVIGNRKEHLRSSVPNFGTLALMSPSDTGAYMIFSPFSVFEETTEKDSDFSYPTGQIFYKLQKTINKEKYEFSIDSVSHGVIMENISLSVVPQFPFVGVLSVDAYLPSALDGIAELPYVDIKVIGVLSRIEDVFRVYFSKNNKVRVIG